MRVIAGCAKGRKLSAVAGMETRPTTDRVKESLFNRIQFELAGRRVLDLFAGTGQLGIEALSRGACHSTFVDCQREAIRTIHANLHATELQGRGQVICTDSLQFLRECGQQFDVIFLDPPYQGEEMAQALRDIGAFDILGEGGIMVCEYPQSRGLPVCSLPYHQEKETRYGAIALTMFRHIKGV